MLGIPYDCSPTLTDAQVMDFCANGYLMLEGVVSDAVNRRTIAWLESHEESEPTAIYHEPWFMDGVIRLPAAAGAVRSLLGKDFHLPVLMSQHRGACPCPAGGWHRDGGSIVTHRLESLQVFYYPQDTPKESGPTEVVPGSQFLRGKATYMGHYGRIAAAVSTAARAGSIFITDYAIWHRRAAATGTGTRHLLKYNFWRTAEPQRDWVVDPAFDFSHRRFFPTGPNAWRTEHLFEQFQVEVAAAKRFAWMSGVTDWRFPGGQAWPVVGSSAGLSPDDDQERIPRELARRRRAAAHAS
jgi:hypothetical protein